MNDEPSAQDQCEANNHVAPMPIPPPQVGAMFPDIAAEEGSMLKAAMDIPFDMPEPPPITQKYDPGHNYGLVISEPLPRYKCHKVVGALEIREVGTNPTTGRTELKCIVPDKKDATVIVMDEWVYKHKPQVGGFVVIYKDGYLSHSPRDAFLEGYTRIYT